jgi:methyl-accepting chemotaxis protein
VPRPASTGGGGYFSSLLTLPEKELIKKVEGAWPAYLASADRVMKLSYIQQDEEAYAEYQTNAKKAFQIVDDYLSDIVDLNAKLADDAKKIADETAAGSRNVTIGVMVTAGLMSIML